MCAYVVHVCMYVCVHMRAGVGICVCAYAGVCVCVCVCARVLVCIVGQRLFSNSKKHVHVQACVRVCAGMCAFVSCMHMYVQERVCAGMYVCTHVCV